MYFLLFGWIIFGTWSFGCGVYNTHVDENDKSLIFYFGSYIQKAGKTYFLVDRIFSSCDVEQKKVLYQILQMINHFGIMQLSSKCQTKLPLKGTLKNVFFSFELREVSKVLATEFAGYVMGLTIIF